MKNLFPILFFALLPNFMVAQSESPIAFNLQENLNQIANLQPGSPGGIAYDTRYEGVRGTPFLFEEFHFADIKLNGKTYQDDKVQFRLNLEKNLIHAKFKNGSEASFPMSAFEEIHLKRGIKPMKFILLQSAQVEGRSKGARFYEQLNENAYQLIKLHEKVFKKADYEGAYSNDIRYDEYAPQQQYFIRTPNDTFEKIKLKKKALIKQFPNWESSLNKFAKKHKSRLDNEADLIAFLQLLE